MRYAWRMTRAAARRLARYLRRTGRRAAWCGTGRDAARASIPSSRLSSHRVFVWQHSFWCCR